MLILFHSHGIELWGYASEMNYASVLEHFLCIKEVYNTYDSLYTMEIFMQPQFIEN